MILSSISNGTACGTSDPKPTPAPACGTSDPTPTPACGTSDPKEKKNK